MHNLCANPRTFPRHRHTVQWPYSSPSALNWLMVCDMEWAEQEEGTGCSVLNVADWGVEQSQYRSLLADLLRRLWPSSAWTFIRNHFMRMSECHTTLQHSPQVCSLYHSHTLKNWSFRPCWKDCEYIYSPAHTGIQRTNILLLFLRKDSQSFQKTES